MMVMMVIWYPYVCVCELSEKPEKPINLYNQRSLTVYVEYV